MVFHSRVCSSFILHGWCTESKPERSAYRTCALGACRSSVSFLPWESKVPLFKFQPAQPPHTIFVPTLDTCRYGSLLQGCMAAGKPALLVGGTGVGKSAIVKVQWHFVASQADKRLLWTGMCAYQPYVAFRVTPDLHALPAVHITSMQQASLVCNPDSNKCCTNQIAAS